MSFNRLTIQSLQAQRQQAAYNGLSGLGTTIADTSTPRPSIDYVRAGDVIRVSLVWNSAQGSFVFDLSPVYAAFKAGLGKTFNVVSMSPATNWLPGGTIVVDVQARGDFAHLQDVTSIVAHEAYIAGLNVDVATTRAEFVSKVETTGGKVPGTIPDPNKTNANTITDFLNKLTESPTTLAVILGAAVILVIAAKK